MPESFWRDLGTAARSLTRRPVYLVLNLTLLVIAAAAVTAIFAVVSATLLRPLPYRDPTRLIAIITTEPLSNGSLQDRASAAVQAVRFRDAANIVERVEAQTPVTVSLTGDGEPRSLRGFAISAGLFDLLGTPPVVGRSFRREEETATSGVVMLAQSVAEQRFGSAAAAIGKTVTIDESPRNVVGVMPAGYSTLFQGGDVWLPLDFSAAQQARAGVRILQLTGRLAPNATIPQGLAELSAIQRAITQELPDNFPHTGIKVLPLRERLFGSSRTGMFILVGALMLVMLIAIANVGNLGLADAINRRRLTATRLALGASRASVINLRLSASIIMAAVGALLGLALGVAMLKIVLNVNPGAVPALGDHWIDWRVVAATLTASLFISVCAALPVALFESGTDIARLAGTDSKSVGSGFEQRARKGLVVAQVSLTVMLLVTCAVFGRFASKLLARDTGFNREQRVAVIMGLPVSALTTVEARAQYVDNMVRSVAEVPGVDGVSTIQSRFVLNETMQTDLEILGRPKPTTTRDVSQIRHVMPNVFRVMGIPIVRGRGIDSTDRKDAPLVAVVSESFAKQYWPGEESIGKQLRRARADAPWMTVIGVVRDITDAGAGVEIGPTLYVAYLQQNTPTARVTLVARVRGEPSTLVRGIREAVWKASPRQAIDQIVPLSTLMAVSAAEPRFQTLVLTTFGTVALLLVGAGVYGLTLFSVLTRTREFGVRSALGASPQKILMTASSEGMSPVVAGTMLGLVAAYPLFKLIQRWTKVPFDPADVPYVVVALAVLLAIAALASLVPARRASRVSPAAALRVG
jgi:predicted permease